MVIINPLTKQIGMILSVCGGAYYDIKLLGNHFTLNVENRPHGLLDNQ